MSAAAEPVIRLTTPGDIVASIPHLCGFVPTESLVAISLRGERKRIGLTLRHDLLDPELDDEVARSVASRLAFDRAEAAVLVVYGDNSVGRPPLVRALRAALEKDGITVMEALHVWAGRW